MKARHFAGIAFVAIAVSACGSEKSGGDAKGGGGSAADAKPAKSAPASTGDATAEQVAKEARGKVSCPAKIKTPARAEGAPVDDIVGLRPGLTYEEATNLILCDNPMLVVNQDNSRGFRMQTYGQTIRQGITARFAEPRIQKSSQEIMKEMQDDMMARSGNRVREDDMAPGKVKYYAATMGMPGQERVIYAAREEWFAEGANPPVSGVMQALTEKYGEPTKISEGGQSHVMSWISDPMGRRVSETSPLFYNCGGIADPDSGANLSPDCGVSVQAHVFALADNPGLAQYLQVGVIDQANGYASLTATEEALRAGDEARKAKELEEAGKNAAPTKL